MRDSNIRDKDSFKIALTKILVRGCLTAGVRFILIQATFHTAAPVEGRFKWTLRRQANEG